MISFREKGNHRTTNLSATMKNAPARFCIRLGLGSVGLLLASCALPPQQAWRVIKKEGLIPYIAMEINHRQAPPSSRYIGSGSVAQTPVARPADQSKAVSAPVTPPPSPVLVNRSAASTTVVAAPTSGRPLKPQARSAAEALAATPKPVAPAPAKKPAETVVKAPPTIAKKIDQKPAAQVPAPAKKPDTKPEVATKPTPAPKPSAPPVENKPAASAPAKPSVAAAPTVTKSDDLPYGSPVTGRPGLVNSPYAGKMQLVDVTGLKPGQEVKCPYSGKLFRVPPGATATAKQAADAPAKK